MMKSVFLAVKRDHNRTLLKDFVTVILYCIPISAFFGKRPLLFFLLVNNCIPNSFHSFLGRHFICCLHWYLRNFLRNMIPFIFFNRDSCLMLWAQIRSHAMFHTDIIFSNFSCRFLNPNKFFPIWLIIVLMYYIWKQDYLKKN